MAVPPVVVGLKRTGLSSPSTWGAFKGRRRSMEQRWSPPLWEEEEGDKSSLLDVERRATVVETARSKKGVGGASPRRSGSPEARDGDRPARSWSGEHVEPSSGVRP